MDQRVQTYRLGYFYIVILSFLLLCPGSSISFGQISKDHQSYTVQQGETISSIADTLGDHDFWQNLYEANADIIDGNITPGQVLTIPPSIINSPNFAYSEKKKSPSDLQKFRKAFNKLVDKEKAKKESNQQDPNLDLGGFVLDETRSKMGRDFYHLFYQHWQPPENAGNFTITISERPSFGRGTQVTVKINYESIYEARLQPRYEYIEAVSKQAVSRAQYVVSQQASVRQQLKGY